MNSIYRKLMLKVLNVAQIVLLVNKLCGSFMCLCSPIIPDIWDETTIEISSNFQIDNNDQNFTRDPKVLNFFPVPVEEECNANDGRRKGICMNPYECRMQSGSSKGSCALGFGVCCVFTVTCEQDVFNNITYFVNPTFPDLTRDIEECSVKIKKIDPEIAQIKLDFIHFNLGQPNRLNGICEDDVFAMSGNTNLEFTLCGINSGQHAYFDIAETDETIMINMNMSKKTVSRLWEIRITQIPFAQRAPESCLQYHTGTKGILQTMNFAENGRYLSNQNYNICMRQEEGMCSIAYEPCDENSFKIGNVKPYIQQFDNVGNTTDHEDLDVGSGDGTIVSQEIEDKPQPRLNTEMCTNGILFPCDNEDLLLPTGMPTSYQNGYCSMAHCGSSLCPNGEDPCRVESNVIPFTVGVQLSATGREESPDDNIGMCLKYEQLPCVV